MRLIPQVVLTVLLLLTIPATVAGNWTKRQVFNTSAFVETVAPLADAPEVQEQATNQIMGFIDDAVAGKVEGIDRGALKFAANATYESQKPKIQKIVELVIQSNEFETAFTEISKGTHAVIVELLTSGESDLIKSEDGMVYLDLTPAYELLVQQLKDLDVADLSASVGTNTPAPQLQLELFESKGLANAQRYANLLDKVALLLLIVSAVAMVLYVVLARNKGLGVFGLGIIILVSMALLRTGHFLGEEFLLGEIPDPAQKSLASEVYTIVLRSLLDWIEIGAAIGAVAVVAGFLWSRVRPAAF